MKVEFVATSTELLCTLSAPTEGWIAVGFNRPDGDLKGARLIMTRMEGGRVVAEVHRADPPRHVRRAPPGGSDRVRVLGGDRTPSVTTVRIAVPWEGEAIDDPTLVPGQPILVILAWSIASDFQHHSRLREHRVVILPSAAP